MTGPSVETDWEALFGIAAGHTLTPARHRRLSRVDRVRDTRWFDEHDAQSRLVACYRSWFERSLRAPFGGELGWERFSPDGRLLDREVRRSTPASVRALH